MENKHIKFENKKLEKFEAPKVETIQIDDSNTICTSTECLAKGTKITLANGSTKNIEDIEVNDVVLSFNHEKGCYENSEVMYVYKCDAPKYSFALTFEDNTELSIIGEHDLFEKESLKYVTLSEENAESFIGKHFYSYNKKAYIELKNVTRNTEKVEYYEIYTRNSLNCIANGMLNVADDVDFLLNIFEFNEDLTIDHDKLNEDIKTFGLFSYSSEFEYSEKEYNDWKAVYVNIVIGKNLRTMEELKNQHEDYNNQVAAKRLSSSLKIDSKIATL